MLKPPFNVMSKGAYSDRRCWSAFLAKIRFGGYSLDLPRNRAVRIGIGILLILGGIVGFLPVLGFWMLPLGLALLAQDVPVMRGPFARVIASVNRKLATKSPN